MRERIDAEALVEQSLGHIVKAAIAAVGAKIAVYQFGIAQAVAAVAVTAKAHSAAVTVGVIIVAPIAITISSFALAIAVGTAPTDPTLVKQATTTTITPQTRNHQSC